VQCALCYCTPGNPRGSIIRVRLIPQSSGPGQAEKQGRSSQDGPGGSTAGPSQLWSRAEPRRGPERNDWCNILSETFQNQGRAGGRGQGRARGRGRGNGIHCIMYTIQSVTSIRRSSCPEPAVHTAHTGSSADNQPTNDFYMDLEL
jgi:hypothetical protein